MAKSHDSLLLDLCAVLVQITHALRRGRMTPKRAADLLDIVVDIMELELNRKKSKGDDG
jgi:hypothetical protein